MVRSFVVLAALAGLMLLGACTPDEEPPIRRAPTPLAELRGLGDACLYDDECSSARCGFARTRSAGSVCVPPELGAPCSGETCARGLFCTTLGVCELAPCWTGVCGDVGDPCEFVDQCETEQCAFDGPLAGTCLAFECSLPAERCAPGESCLMTLGCGLTCEPERTAGETCIEWSRDDPCSTFGHGCAAGLECMVVSGCLNCQSATATCIVPHQEGEGPCDARLDAPDDGCAEGLACDFETETCERG